MAGVYALLLNDDTQYVGMSDNIPYRIQKHKEGTGSEITKEKGIKEILKTITPENIDHSQWEKTETLERMMNFGFNKVRGFQWTSSKPLSYNDAYMIKKLILGEYNVCYKCGNGGHYANNCIATNEKAEWFIEIDNIINETKQNNTQKIIQCYKCNRIGHYANKCPLKGMSYNTYSNCDSSDDEYYSSKPQKKIKCYNCGKFGHYSKNCYAKKSYKK